jgi:DNA polymerase
MGWASAIKKTPVALAAAAAFAWPTFPTYPVDWARLVTIDFESFWDVDYTLSKLSTSEYVRDTRFKAQMMALKVGTKPTRVIPGRRIAAELAKINWATHTVLCHNTQFDGFILSHHYNVIPLFYYDTLSMARGLHSNEIGAGLDEVTRFYGGKGKIDGTLEKTKGVLNWPKALYVEAAIYCAQDNDECFDVFKKMHAKYPADEIELIDLTIRMFCAPVLKVDIPRVEKELKRELDRREVLFSTVLDPKLYYDQKLLKGAAEKALPTADQDRIIVKRVLGSSERYADLLRAEGIEPPKKISPAWMKKSPADRMLCIDDKYAYAFAKDDIAFNTLPDKIELWGADLDLNKVKDVAIAAKRQARIRTLVDCRIAVKSTTNVTRAQRFLTAGARGMALPCGYAYFRAHTGRWGGNNKMNMQNLTRGGELRLSILAAAGHRVAVADSGQIEARVNGWLWGQQDLLDGFRAADTGTGLDNYCTFATEIYHRPITKADKTERFVGKVCVLGLGFQMGAPKLQMTLAKGALGGPPVYFTLDQCKAIVNTYRRRNHKIEAGWKVCTQIIEDMAAGVPGSHRCISWEADTIWLPNGMSLKYPGLKKGISESTGYDEWTYAADQEGKVRKKIYGGLLCENIVQALARIIVGWQMLQISRKYRVVMTTHDEVVCHPKAAQAQRCYDHMFKWMTTPLSWCLDLPLFAEGGTDVNYSK